MVYNFVLGRGYMQASFYVRKMQKTAEPGAVWAVLHREDQLMGLRNSSAMKVVVHYLPDSVHNPIYLKVVRIVPERGFEEVDVGDNDD